MRRQILLASFAVATLILGALTRSPAADDKAGFTPLFNGRDFTGWKIFLQRNADNAQTKTFTIENGEIHCTGRPNGYMITEKEYGDYVLRVRDLLAGESGAGRNHKRLGQSPSPQRAPENAVREHRRM